ncbi:MAG: MFS transporter [Desulfovibrio sp.]|jgi:MFS family permease|nr:MFS transporter [Desulfovibrio sp.]
MARTLGLPPPHLPSCVPGERLLTRDFMFLFIVAMFSNSNVAVFYCFEQWLESVAIAPGWRGMLISSMFLMVLLGRPLASMAFLNRGRLPASMLSTLTLVLVMLCYLWVEGEHLMWWVLLLRLLQGAAIAVQSSCIVAVLVNCIPPGQSARGFALFSLTFLLPFSIIPALSEQVLLPFLQDEAMLFASTSVLMVISVLLLIPLAPRLRSPDAGMGGETREGGMTIGAVWRGLMHSGLACVYVACFTFSCMTQFAIFFIKGLGRLTGAQPAWFFTIYTLTVIFVRLLGSNRLDALPHHRIIAISCVGLCCVMLGLAYGPGWSFIPCTLGYGVGLGLLYPMLASVVYDRSTPANRSFNSNIMMSAFDAAGMMAPLVGGVVVHLGWGYRGVFVVSALSVALCGMSMFVDWLRQRR